jgi:hypothetical protein
VRRLSPLWRWPEGKRLVVGRTARGGGNDPVLGSDAEFITAHPGEGHDARKRDTSVTAPGDDPNSVSQWLDEQCAAVPAPDADEVGLASRSAKAQDREARFLAFCQTKRCTKISVANSAGVDKSDLHRWRKGKLPDRSKTSQRIDDVLSGKTFLQRSGLDEATSSWLQGEVAPKKPRKVPALS